MRNRQIEFLLLRELDHWMKEKYLFSKTSNWKKLLDYSMAWSYDAAANSLVLVDKKRHHEVDTIFPFGMLSIMLLLSFRLYSLDRFDNRRCLWLYMCNLDRFSDIRERLCYLFSLLISASLISYGFTSSGMTYSLYGDGTDSGVVHLLVQELLKQEVNYRSVFLAGFFSIFFSLLRRSLQRKCTRPFSVSHSSADSRKFWSRLFRGFETAPFLFFFWFLQSIASFRLFSSSCHLVFSHAIQFPRLIRDWAVLTQFLASISHAAPVKQMCCV